MQYVFKLIAIEMEIRIVPSLFFKMWWRNRVTYTLTYIQRIPWKFRVNLRVLLQQQNLYSKP